MLLNHKVRQLNTIRTSIDLILKKAFNSDSIKRQYRSPLGIQARTLVIHKEMYFSHRLFSKTIMCRMNKRRHRKKKTLSPLRNYQRGIVNTTSSIL